MTFGPKSFPTLLIILDICAAIVYAGGKDWGRCIYWFCAGVLSYSVVYLIKT